MNSLTAIKDSADIGNVALLFFIILVCVWTTYRMNTAHDARILCATSTMANLAMHEMAHEYASARMGGYSKRHARARIRGIARRKFNFRDDVASLTCFNAARKGEEIFEALGT